MVAFDDGFVRALKSGRVMMKPGVDRVEGQNVCFADGSTCGPDVGHLRHRLPACALAAGRVPGGTGRIRHASVHRPVVLAAPPRPVVLRAGPQPVRAPSSHHSHRPRVPTAALTTTTPPSRPARRSRRFTPQVHEPVARVAGLPRARIVPSGVTVPWRRPINSPSQPAGHMAAHTQRHYP